MPDTTTLIIFIFCLVGCCVTSYLSGIVAGCRAGHNAAIKKAINDLNIIISSKQDKEK